MGIIRGAVKTAFLLIGSDEMVKINENKGRIAVIIGMIILTIFSLYADKMQKEKAKLMAISKFKTLQNLTIEFVKDDKGVINTSFEYGKDIIDVNKLIKSHTGNLEIEGPLSIDTSKVGNYEVIYHLSDIDEYQQEVNWDVTKNYEVKDTKAPEIILGQDKVSIVLNNSYDILSNIEYIKDPIDGDLVKVDSEPKKLTSAESGKIYDQGWYIVDGSLDTTTIGDYNINIKASDVNGNISEKAYTISVYKPAPAIVSTASITSGGQVNNKTYIYNYLTNTLGMTKASACGVLANINQESGFNPQSGSSFYGLCQWGGGRLNNLINYCNSNGLDYRSVQGQTAFLGYELTTSYAYVFNQMQACPDSAQGAYDAAEIFRSQYERSAVYANISATAAGYWSNLK